MRQAERTHLQPFAGAGESGGFSSLPPVAGVEEDEVRVRTSAVLGRGEEGMEGAGEGSGGRREEEEEKPGSDFGRKAWGFLSRMIWTAAARAFSSWGLFLQSTHAQLVQYAPKAKHSQ